MQFRDHIFARRLQIAKHRNALANRFEILQSQRNACGARNRQQVQNGIGRAAGSHHHRDGVLERLARHDLARQQLPAHGFGQDFRGFRGALFLFVILRRHRRRVRQTHAHRFDGRGHRIRREHPPARPDSRTGMPLHFQQLRPVDSPRAVFAHRFERADHGEIFAVQPPGLDRAAINEDRGNIQPRDRHHRAGHVLVAAADGHAARPPPPRCTPSRSSPRSPRATPANTSFPPCPWRCRRSP